MMEKLTVDAEGKIIIPPEVIQKGGLHPGDELTLVESDEGLLVFTRAALMKKLRRGGTDSTTRSACLQKMMLAVTRV